MTFYINQYHDVQSIVDEAPDNSTYDVSLRDYVMFRFDDNKDVVLTGTRLATLVRSIGKITDLVDLARAEFSHVDDSSVDAEIVQAEYVLKFKKLAKDLELVLPNKRWGR
tara:strand:+ start:395 stop:724 length:330 start_codon:yes stop_codon:yes gene_type:complete